MTVDQARVLVQALQLAIVTAERTNSAVVDLQPNLQQLDDQARAELAQAIAGAAAVAPRLN